MKHKGTIFSAEFSSNGKRIVTADRAQARVWDVATGQPVSDPMGPDGSAGSGAFSPDGKQIVAAAYDQPARIWDVMPAPEAWPKWLPRLAEAVAGEHLNAHGLFEPLTQSPNEVLKEIKEQLRREPVDDEWATWGRWFLADRSKRTISPFSRITVPQYIQNRITDNTAASLDEAEQLAVGNAELLNRITTARAALPKSPER